MNEHALYNIKRGPHGYAIGKFDRDLNLLAAYNTDTKYCSCPAGPRPTCRHRKMLPRMLAKVDQPEFYCYETQTWHRPLEAFGLEPSERGAEQALLGEAVSCRESSEVEMEVATKLHQQIEEGLEEPYVEPILSGTKIIEPLAAPTIRRR